MLRYLNKLKWWFLYRTFYRYNIIKLDLKPGYYDIDYRMLYACFSLLSDFVEKERDGIVGLNKDIDYLTNSLMFLPDDAQNMGGLGWKESARIQLEGDKQILRLYCYWKIERPTLKMNAENVLMSKATDRYGEYNRLEEELHNKDDEMLKLLMKYRRHLWT